MVCVALAGAVAAAGPAGADAQSLLDSGVTAARGASACPALQADPAVTRSAELATQGTSDYINFRTAAVPFTDPTAALKTIGYTGAKAQLFSGYGQSDADAVTGLLTQARNGIADCSYTQYGVSAIQADDGSILTALVLAAP